LEEENSSALVMNRLDTGAGSKNKPKIKVRWRSVCTVQTVHNYPTSLYKAKDFRSCREKCAAVDVDRLSSYRNFNGGKK